MYLCDMENLTQQPEFIALMRRVEALERKGGKRPTPPPVGERVPSHILAEQYRFKISEAFARPDDLQPATTWLTTDEIAARLTIHSRNLKTLGSTLQKYGFERKSIRTGAKVRARYGVILR